MVDFEISYGTYLSISDDEKFYYDFCLQYSKNKFDVKDYFSEIDLSERNFIFVKEAFEYYNADDFENLYIHFTALPEYGEQAFLKSPAYKVLLTFKFLIQRIVELQKLENEILVSNVADDSNAQQYIEQVDFTIFPNYYSELRELANGDILKFDAIKNSRYSDCVVELAYRTKLNDVDKLITRAYKTSH